MEEIRDFISNDIQRRLARQAQLTSFVEKAIGVLLAKAFSSTAYEILTSAMAGNGSLDSGEEVIARSFYVFFITLYAPCVAWALTKFAPKGISFRAIVLQNHAKVCPVLLAWGWKDWAAQLTTWSGERDEHWIRHVLALSLTIFIVTAQVLPCVKQFKSRVAAGGASDTILARIMIFPGSLLLTLGYVWNNAATYHVGELADLHKNPKHPYRFQLFCQLVYCLSVCTIITVVTGLLSRRAAETEVHGEKHQQNEDGSEKKQLPEVCKTPSSKAHICAHHIEDWSGLNHLDLTSVITGALSFIYAWALLDTTDEFGFGLLFQCGGSSSCSYQQNFAYATGLSIVFTGCSFVLHSWKEFEKDSATLTTAISLQLNAMILTVGWAWMNFYSVMMASATSDSNRGDRVVFYISSSITIGIFHSMTSFVLQRTNQGMIRTLKDTMDNLNKSAQSSDKDTVNTSVQSCGDQQAAEARNIDKRFEDKIDSMSPAEIRRLIREEVLDLQFESEGKPWTSEAQWRSQGKLSSGSGNSI